MTNKQNDDFDLDETFEEEGFNDSFDETGEESELDDDNLDLDGLEDDPEQEEIDESEAEQEEEYEQSHEPSAHASVPAADPAPKPFFKTPAGMATIGASVVMTAVAGTTLVRLMSPEQAPQAEFEVVVDQNMLPPVAPVPVEPPAVVQPLPQNGLEPVQVISEPSPAPVQATADDLLAQVPDKIGEISSAVEGHNEDLAAVKEQVDQLSNQVAALLEAQDEDSIASLEAEIEQLKLTVSQLQAFKVEVEKASAGEPAAELSDETLAKLKGRKRVGGLLVTDVSRSGEMSVIKRPSTNRVFTLFTGEVLNLPQGRQVVGEVLEQGNVVLLGTDYFIDRTLDPIPTAKPRPTKSTAAKKSAPAEPRQPKAPDEPKVISGYSLNAIYDAEKSFGIINSKGDFEAVTKGQSIKGLGTVKGLDSQGNLLVGDGVIRSVY